MKSQEDIPAKSFYILCAALLLIAPCLCLYFLHRGFYAISWDESGRTLDAYWWYAHGVPHDPIWLPFYRVCVGSALKLYPNLILTPRIVTCLFGLIAAIAGAWLAHELFLNRKITLLTLALNVFLSQRIALSLAPLSEMMFIAIALVAMAAFANWLRTGNRAAMWTCAIAAAIASTIRYEGWVFNAAMLLTALIRHLSTGKPGRKELAFWALLLFAYPALRLISQFVNVSQFAGALVDEQQFTIRQILRKNPLVEFVFANGVTLNLVGLAGVFQVLRKSQWQQKAIAAISFLPLICISLGLLLVRAVQTSASWRMTCIWTMLLIPFTARFLLGEEWTLLPGKSTQTLQLCAAALLLTAFTVDTFRIMHQSEWAFPLSDRLAGRYIESQIDKDPGTRILIESSLFFYLTIEVASQHPDSFIQNSLPEQPSPPILAKGASVRSVVDSQKIRLLVFTTDEYKRFLDSSPDVTKVAEFGSWAIYQPVR